MNFAIGRPVRCGHLWQGLGFMLDNADSRASVPANMTRAMTFGESGIGYYG